MEYYYTKLSSGSALPAGAGEPFAAACSGQSGGMRRLSVHHCPSVHYHLPEAAQATLHTSAPDSDHHEMANGVRLLSHFTTLSATPHSSFFADAVCDMGPNVLRTGGTKAEKSPVPPCGSCTVYIKAPLAFLQLPSRLHPLPLNYLSLELGWSLQAEPFHPHRVESWFSHHFTNYSLYLRPNKTLVAQHLHPNPG